MFYCDGFLHAIVDEGLLPSNDEARSASEREDLNLRSSPKSDGKPKDIGAASFITGDVSASSAADNLPGIDLPGNECKEKLSNKQQQKAKRKLIKQQAKDLKRHRQVEDNLTKNRTSSPQSQAVALPLRLHQFVSTVFRSELNVAENGAGHFIKNAPRVSAHHAILHGVIKLNGQVCKLGRTQLALGDVVSLQLEEEVSRRNGDLIAWRGSEEVARGLEGVRDQGERQGRMSASTNGEVSIRMDSLSGCDMIQYYREKFGKAWNPEIHESAIIKPLPLTLRVLKPSTQLDSELTELGFSPVNEEQDFRLQDENGRKLLSKSAMRELLGNTWIARDNLKRTDSSERKLGLLLCEGRVTGELMQQELTSMIPVAIMTAHLKKQKMSVQTGLRFLDLCSAPGSKTCQLISALERVMPTKNGGTAEVDFTVVANELSHQRANWMRQRLHQQSGCMALSNLIVTCADGRAYAKMEQNIFDYILCDVPCSGDGTVRKSPKILGKWSPKNAEKNKPLQKELLKVGLGLLRPSESNDNDGFLVYSTCSLNPLENEQVVSEVIHELNGNTESVFEFELVDLSDNSGQRNNFLRILPAKSHGGFFVAGIRKFNKISLGGCDSQTIAKPCYTDDKKCTTIVNVKKHELVKRQVQNNTKDDTTTISYSISPCTRRCCAEIIEKMGTSTIISSGIAVLYESNDSEGPALHYVLQQGCASLVKQQHRECLSCIQLSPAEFLECHAKRPDHREILLAMDRNIQFNTKGLARGQPLIIGIASSSAEDDLTFFLPARIVEVSINDKADIASIAVEIIARPQIFRRTSTSSHKPQTQTPKPPQISTPQPPKQTPENAYSTFHSPV
ncbi:hypothetical protein ACHAXR_007910 [Thalassiosira sp. AJA248-18]